MELDELILRIQEKKMNFKVFEVMHSHNRNPQCYCVYIVKDVVEKAQKPNILEMEEPIPHLNQVHLRKNQGHCIKFVVLYLI